MYIRKTPCPLKIKNWFCIHIRFLTNLELKNTNFCYVLLGIGSFMLRSKIIHNIHIITLYYLILVKINFIYWVIKITRSITLLSKYLQFFLQLCHNNVYMSMIIYDRCCSWDTYVFVYTLYTKAKVHLILNCYIYHN